MENIENENVKKEFTEFDKIFIPEDLDNSVGEEALASFKHNVKGFRVVPQNYSLVKKNIFTQKNVNVKGYGVKFFAPLFTKSILVSRQRGIKKYSNVKTYTKDGEEIAADFDVIMKIVDPAKYVVEGKNRISELSALITRLLRIYVSTKNVETVIQGKCVISDFDPNAELEEFADRYGIEIQEVLIEKVELSANLKKLYNDTIEEKQRRLAQAEKLQAAKEKAMAAAEITRISYGVEAEKIRATETAKNDAYIEKIAKLCMELKNKGLSDKSIDEYIKTFILSDKGNAVFIGNNLDSQNIAAGIAGGEHVSNKIVEGKRSTK